MVPDNTHTHTHITYIIYALPHKQQQHGSNILKLIATLVNSVVLHYRRRITLCHYKSPGMSVEEKEKTDDKGKNKQVIDATERNNREWRDETGGRQRHKDRDV